MAETDVRVGDGTLNSSIPAGSSDSRADGCCQNGDRKLMWLLFRLHYFVSQPETSQAKLSLCWEWLAIFLIALLIREPPLVEICACAKTQVLFWTSWSNPFLVLSNKVWVNLFLICNSKKKKKKSLFFFWYGVKKDEKSRYSEKKLCAPGCILWIQMYCLCKSFFRWFNTGTLRLCFIIKLWF